MSKKLIYYKLNKPGNEWNLYSGVETNFDGIAWNYVKSSTMKADLILFADQQGWTEWEWIV